MTETAIYVHGVSADGVQGHTAEYEALHQGIRAYNDDWPKAYCGVEWGWHPLEREDPMSHELLASAQSIIGQRAFRAVDRESDFTLNLLRIAVEKFRPLVLYNFSDMFYYVSTQGKHGIRLAFAQALVNSLEEELAKADPLISLTLIGHSAGSVVAFDTLFYLFYPDRKQKEFVDPQATPEGCVAAERVPGKPGVKRTLDELGKLRDLAHRNRLRVRRLFTLGSPITPLAFRSDAVLKIFTTNPPTGGRLKAEWHGLEANPPEFGAPLANPRWLNVWDKDDPIAWPVEPIMTSPGTVVVDRYVDVSDSPLKAHEAYWRSDDVHRVIAKAW